MAESPAHKLGQIAGYTMEEALYEMLVPIAEEFGLYIDRQGLREPARRGKFVQWADDLGNKHNLDFVLERGGTEQQVGTPVAFVESAWRRYTKHSVNKAGELANALVPLRRTNAHHRPFLGALVAGEWTDGGIAHMESQGIHVLHLPTSVIVEAFAVEGLDLLLGEGTPREYMSAQTEAWEAMGPERQARVVAALSEAAGEKFESFVERLRVHLSRGVESVLILPLRGEALVANSIPEAIRMLAALDVQIESVRYLPLVRIEVQVRYSNTDRIDALFEHLSDAMSWLEQNYLDA